MNEDEVGDALMVLITRNLLPEEVNDFRAVSNDGRRALMLESLVWISSMGSDERQHLYGYKLQTR